MVDANAKAKPASAASTPGVSIAVTPVIPSTTLERRLKRAESHRLTDHIHQNGFMFYTNEVQLWFTERFEWTDSVNATQHVAQELGASAECTDDRNTCEYIFRTTYTRLGEG